MNALLQSLDQFFKVSDYYGVPALVILCLFASVGVTTYWLKPLTINQQHPQVIIIPSAPDAEKIPLPADVLFDFDDSKIKPSTESEILKWIPTLKAKDAKQLFVIGHTDAIGDETYNLELSRKRAKAVAGLLSKHLPQIPITDFGLGANIPIKPADQCPREPLEAQKQCLEPNRRVEIVFSNRIRSLPEHL